MLHPRGFPPPPPTPLALAFTSLQRRSEKLLFTRDSSSRGGGDIVMWPLVLPNPRRPALVQLARPNMVTPQSSLPVDTHTFISECIVSALKHPTRATCSRPPGRPRLPWARRLWGTMATWWIHGRWCFASTLSKAPQSAWCPDGSRSLRSSSKCAPKHPFPPPVPGPANLILIIDPIRLVIVS